MIEEREEDNMKKQYENAEMEIVEFEALDVITLSDTEDSDTGWGDIH